MRGKARGKHVIITRFWLQRVAAVLACAFVILLSTIAVPLVGMLMLEVGGVWGRESDLTVLIWSTIAGSIGLALGFREARRIYPQIAKPRFPEGCCHACGYDLRGNPTGSRCPECGACISAFPI
jgi:hypothetical protein